MSKIAAHIEAADDPDTWRRRLASAWVSGQVVPVDAEPDTVTAEQIGTAIGGFLGTVTRVAIGVALGIWLYQALLA